MAGLLSLNQALFTSINERTSSVGLFRLSSNPTNPLTEFYAGAEGIKFQYFPETLTDTKAINYATKDIPGGSLPIYQWVSSGARTIAFQAHFSCDVDLVTGKDDDFYGRNKQVGQGRRNQDIRSAFYWLRSYMMPAYSRDKTSASGVTTQAPDKLILIIPNSGIGITGGITRFAGSKNDIAVDSVNCVMTQCDITYESFFTSGLPRLASVQLSFAQVPQSAGRVEFPHFAKENRGNFEAGNFFGYNLKP